MNFDEVVECLSESGNFNADCVQDTFFFWFDVFFCVGYVFGSMVI